MVIKFGRQKSVFLSLMLHHYHRLDGWRAAGLHKPLNHLPWPLSTSGEAVGVPGKLTAAIFTAKP